MTVRIGINGFGRIGRSYLRAALRSGADVEVVAVNDVADAATLGLAPGVGLPRRPPGRRAGRRRRDPRWRTSGSGSARSASPRRIPWGDERRRRRHRVHRPVHRLGQRPPAPGRGRAEGHHLGAGRRRRPRGRARGQRRHARPDASDVFSNGSCTTNCLAPMAKVLHDAFGIESGLMTTIHAYTSDQRLQDAPHDDLRRARAAALSTIPTSSGAARTIGRIIPELDGRLTAVSLRVPVPVGSITDLTARLSRPATVDEVNAAFRTAAATPGLSPYLPTPRRRWSPPTSSATPTRRSSTRRSPRSSATRSRSSPGTTTSGASPTDWSSSPRGSLRRS